MTEAAIKNNLPYNSKYKCWVWTPSHDFPSVQGIILSVSRISNNRLFIRIKYTNGLAEDNGKIISFIIQNKNYPFIHWRAGFGYFYYNIYGELDVSVKRKTKSTKINNIIIGILYDTSLSVKCRILLIKLITLHNIPNKPRGIKRNKLQSFVGFCPLRTLKNLKEKKWCRYEWHKRSDRLLVWLNETEIQKVAISDSRLGFNLGKLAGILITTNREKLPSVLALLHILIKADKTLPIFDFSIREVCKEVAISRNRLNLNLYKPARIEIEDGGLRKKSTISVDWEGLRKDIKDFDMKRFRDFF